MVRVPIGTVVKFIGWGNNVIKEGGSDVGGVESERESRWVHYPGWAEANLKRQDFKEAGRWLEREEKRRMWEERKKWDARIAGGREIDLDAELSESNEVDTVNAPLGKKQKEPLGYLLASGGAGGLGNPHFCANLNTPASSQSASAFARSPKFATRGLQGDFVTVSLELRTPADVALVGRCNAGKSTLIRALTGGRVKSDVGGWEGVTRDVVRGVVRVAQWKWEGEAQGEERVWEGMLGDVRVFDESMEIGSKKRASVNEEEEFSLVPTKPGHGFDLYESFRFMITDNPGFVVATPPDQKIAAEEEDKEPAPITQTILRSIERAKVLVYVVDLSNDAPWDELQNVIQEVARGQGGGKNQTRRGLVVANKADLLVRGSVGEGMEPEVKAEVAEAQAKLHRLEDFVRGEMGHEVDVVPVSAKWGMNLGKVVRTLEELLKGAAN